MRNERKKHGRYPSERSLENLKLKRKPVIWNDQRFDSVTEFRKHVKRSEGYIYTAMRNNWKVAGYYWDYEIDYL